MMMLVWVERRIFLKTNKDVGVRSMNCHGKRNQEIYKVKVLYFSSEFPRIEITIFIYRNIHDPLSLSTTLTHSLARVHLGYFESQIKMEKNYKWMRTMGKLKEQHGKRFFVKKAFISSSSCYFSSPNIQFMYVCACWTDFITFVIC